MSLRALLFLLSAILPSSVLSAALRSQPEPEPIQLPLIIWHGLGDSYAADGMKSVASLAQTVNPGTYVYNIRLDDDASADRTASFFGNLSTQLAAVCAALGADPILSTAPAVNALGFSQGGLFLRGYVERCNAPPVATLLTFGSPHNGVAEFGDCSAGDWVCRGALALLRANTWGAFVQSRVVPAQYYRRLNDSTGEPSEEYLANSNFLADVNNEREVKNATYAARLARLARFVMYAFEEDTTVIPKQSEWFAEVNATSGEVTPLRERDIYKEDWLGLKALDERGGLIFRTVPGKHMELDDKVLGEAFLEYFGPGREASFVAQHSPASQQVLRMDLR